MSLKILFIGDVVGSPGRKIVSQALPRIIPRWEIGLVVCNAENAAGGSGLTINCHEELAEAGVDVFTLGDHAYRKDEVFTLFERSDRILRAANYPPDAPGAEWTVAEATRRDAGRRVHADGADVHEAGRLPVPRGRPGAGGAGSLGPRRSSSTSTPRRRATSSSSAATSTAASRPCSARTRTSRRPTSRSCRAGTAYQSDVGMTGPYDSILGRRYDRVLAATLTNVPHFFDVATGDPRLCGALVEVDPATGRATAIKRVDLRADDVRALMT